MRPVRTILSQSAFQLLEMRAAAAASSRVDEKLISDTAIAIDSSRRLLQQLENPVEHAGHLGDRAPLDGKAR